jgi:hypothetical protein
VASYSAVASASDSGVADTHPKALSPACPAGDHGGRRHHHCGYGRVAGHDRPGDQPVTGRTPSRHPRPGDQGGCRFGMTGIFIPAQAAAFAKVPLPKLGRASTLYNSQQRLGSVIGVAVITTTVTALGIGRSFTRGAPHAAARWRRPARACFPNAGEIPGRRTDLRGDQTKRAVRHARGR